MSDYTKDEVERALLPYVGGYFDDMTEEEEAAAELHDSEDGEGWDGLEYKLKGKYLSEGESALTQVTIRGERAPISFVADFGGQGQGDEIWIVFKVGDQLFRKEGYYASHYGSDWDGDLCEVEAVERTVTFYEAKEN